MTKWDPIEVSGEGEGEEERKGERGVRSRVVVLSWKIYKHFRIHMLLKIP